MEADVASTETALPPVPNNADGTPMTRGQMKEACRLAYCSGRAKLVELCVRYQLPYDTLRGWSSTEGWSTDKTEAVTLAATKTVSALAEFIVEQREKQIRRAIGRAGRLQGEVDKLLDAASTLTPKDLQSLATAEERTDLICRRNLSMDDGGQRGPLVNVNALGNVELVG